MNMNRCYQVVDRLAPAQIARPLEDPDEGHGDRNIWYHDRPGKRRKQERGVQARTKCLPAKHEGRTKGGSASDICLHFALGSCHLGHRCNRRHRIPTVEDDLKSDIQHDCFGRARESTEGDNQDGFGSVMKENVTLFVGDFGACCTEDVLRDEFTAFGPLVQIRFFPHKRLAFIQFLWRAR